MSGYGFRKSEGMRFATGQPFLSLAWIPEGLVVTPKTAEAQWGYGFPKRDSETGALINPPFGTQITTANDECLNQVLINQFENNKYLDKKEFIVGLPENYKFPETNARLRASIATEVTPADVRRFPPHVYDALVYEPTGGNGEGEVFWETAENRIEWVDQPGIQFWSGGMKFKPYRTPKAEDDGSLVFEHRQFAEDGTSLIYEVESATWYCHWPEELLYDNEAFETVFQLTNTYRSEVGEQPLTRELRGIGNPSLMALAEMQRAKVMFHDNEALYRYGYEKAQYRIVNSAGGSISAAENLATGMTSGFSATPGEQAALAWRNSPGHYANMIYSGWSSPKYSTSHSVFGGFRTSIEEAGPPRNETYDPPIGGTSYAQIFTKKQSWFGTDYTISTFPGINLGGFDSPIGVGAAYYGGSAGAFTFHGAPVYFPRFSELLLDDKYVLALGASVYLHEGRPWFRCVIAEQYESTIPDRFTGLRLECWTHPVNLYGVNWKQESELVIENYAWFDSMLFFNALGTEAVGALCVIDTSHLFNLYFPVDTSHPNLFKMNRVMVKVTNGILSILNTVEGPNMEYTVETATSGSNTYVSRYAQIGSGAVNSYPFYQGNTLQYVQVRMDVEVDQTYDGTTDTTLFRIHDELIFPSDRRFVMCHQHVVDGTPVADEPCYLQFPLYLDPIQEDIFYLRLDLFKNGIAAEGEFSLYHNDTLLKSWPRYTVSGTGFFRPLLRASWDTATGTTTTTLASGVYETSYTRGKDATGNFRPLGTNSSLAAYVICAGQPSIRYYIGKLLNGTYPASMGIRVGEFAFCAAFSLGSQNYFQVGYNLGVNHPAIKIEFETIMHDYERYKERSVGEVKFSGFWNFTPDPNEERFVYSNFDLEGLVGLGELTSILPMGVMT